MTLVDTQGRKVYKVAICTPCQDTVSRGYARDLALLTAYEVARGTTVTIIQNAGTIIPQQRATLVKKAQEWNATHVLWLDADMRFPQDALERLLEHGEPIVAANYATRRAPILPVAEDKALGFLFTTPESGGLVPVSHVGMGVMLVEMGVYARMKEPWFILGFNPTEKEYIGEDVFFCRRAKEHGYVVLVDQTLSKSVQHVGEMAYKHEHTMVTREVYNAPEVLHGT